MTKEDIKSAMRELMDETTVKYSQGVAGFARSVTRSMSSMVDSFDEFFTENLLQDPNARVTAKAYLDARIAALREATEILGQKIRGFEAQRVRLVALRRREASLMSKRRRARKGHA